MAIWEFGETEDADKAGIYCKGRSQPEATSTCQGVSAVPAILWCSLDAKGSSGNSVARSSGSSWFHNKSAPAAGSRANIVIRFVACIANVRAEIVQGHLSQRASDFLRTMAERPEHTATSASFRSCGIGSSRGQVCRVMVCLFVRLHVLVVGLLLLACLLASLFLSFFLLIVCLFQCTRNAHYFLCRLTTGVVDIFP